MAVVSPRSCLCVKSELDLFTVPPTQTSVKHGCTMDYHPVSTLTDDGPIGFNISGSGEDYIDLANTFLHLGMKITGADGANIAIADSAAIGPVNLLMHSLFSLVDVALYDKLVSSSTNTYAYRVYLKTLLNYGKEAKESQLTSVMWYKDTAGKMDERAVVAAGENKGLVKRASFTKSSKVVDVMGRIHSDIFFQKKLLMNGIGVCVRLVRSKDFFSLVSTEAAPHLQDKDRSSRTACQKGTHLRLCLPGTCKSSGTCKCDVLHSTRGVQDIFNSDWKLRCRPGKLVYGTSVKSSDFRSHGHGYI